MKRKDVTKVVARQISGVTNNLTKIKDGIQSVTVSPGAAAADQIQVMIQKWLEMAQNGTLEAALRGVDLNAWKESALKGADRIAPGMEVARSKLQAFHQALQEYQLGYTAQIDAMAKGTLEASRARMNANFDAMAAFKPKGR